jgi:hypothetical protein
MGKKKKTKTYKTTTVNTTVVKLSYIQTLAVSQGLLDTSNLETQGQTNVNSKTKNSLSTGSIIAPIAAIGIGKGKKTKTTETFDTSGLKIKDQYLHPYFDVIRYSIGIKEINVAKYKFAEQSEFVSIPFISPKEIIKVHISVDEYIPSQFDQTQQWIKYYIKSEGSNDWIEISALNAPTRFDNSGEIIPKIINFNIPKPSVIASENKYNYTESPIKQLRFRAVISRPIGGDNESITPLLKSYRIIMTPRD